MHEEYYEFFSKAPEIKHDILVSPIWVFPSKAQHRPLCEHLIRIVLALFVLRLDSLRRVSHSQTKIPKMIFLLTKFLSGSCDVRAGAQPLLSAWAVVASSQPGWEHCSCARSCSRQHPQAFQKQSCSRPAAVWTRSFVIPNSLCASFDFGGEDFSVFKP